MATVFEHEGTLSPVTALSLFRTHRLLLLAGEGPFLKIYEHSSGCILLQQRIFQSQAVHGIAIETEGAIPHQPARVLLWGGCSVRVVEIFSPDNDPPDIGIAPRLRIDLVHEFNAPDWILDACFSPRGKESHVRAALVTAHNSLHLLTAQQNQLPITIGSSSRSILYSAHILWVSDTHILVAAGTVFGEILVWSCCLADLLNAQAHTNESRTILHYVLTGHEGSIFGVQISPPLPLGGDHPKRLLASCSDDRTLRIWDITSAESTAGAESRAEPYDFTDTGFVVAGALAPQSPARFANLVAIGWAHSSRVWGVRFLPTVQEFGHHAHEVKLLSFGEDATYRLWSLRYGDGTTPHAAALKERLKLIQTCSLHSGKNIWSLAVMKKNSTLLISTGGADGKIASVNIPIYGDGSVLNQRYDVGWSVEDIEALAQSHVPNNEIIEDDAPITPPAPPQESSQADVEDKDSKNLTTSPKPTQKPRNLAPNNLKDYAFLSQADFLTTTTQGQIFLCSIDPSNQTERNMQSYRGENHPSYSVRCKLLAHLDKLKTYSVLGADPTSKMAFFSGSDGTVYLYNHSSGDLQLLFRVDGKVSGLFPLPSSCLLQVLVTCVGSRKGYLGTLKADRDRCRWSMVEIDGHPKDPLVPILGLPETFVVTSAGIAATQNLIFLGSRNGALAVYDIDRISADQHMGWAPSMCFRRIHGADAITLIKLLPEYGNSLASPPSNYILTAGRNGTYAIHQISNYIIGGIRNLMLTTVHVSSPPFGPMVEGAYFDSRTRELILYGFRSKNFIVWNQSKECEIMNVECGGAHRNWSFSPSPFGNGGGIFVWTKSSKLHIRAQFEDSQRTTKNGGHGREVKASAISPPLVLVSEAGQETTRQFLATGAEDTAIRVFDLAQDSINGSDDSMAFKSLGTFKKHKTGIQHLQWTSCGRYLVSSGGFEELFVWRVRWVAGFGVGVCCVGVCPVEAEVPDLRIVSFAVGGLRRLPPADPEGQTSPDGDAEFIITMVCSDSTIKAYRYSSQSKSFRLVLVGQYATCCLTQVFHQRIKDDTYILTAGTDGYVAIWRALNLLDERLPEQTNDIGSICWNWRSRVHQSAVKSMAIVQTTPDSILAITGGDDNALALTHVAFTSGSNNGTSPISSIIRIPKAHASAVTAVAQITTTDPYRAIFASSGNDQKLKLWSVRLGVVGEGLEVRREGSVWTAVADVSGMVVVDGEGAVSVVVCGVGMEGWRVRDGKIGERSRYL